jgi:hypothetical protein
MVDVQALLFLRGFGSGRWRSTCAFHVGHGGFGDLSVRDGVKGRVEMFRTDRKGSETSETGCFEVNTNA